MIARAANRASPPARRAAPPARPRRSRSPLARGARPRRAAAATAPPPPPRPARPSAPRSSTPTATGSSSPARASRSPTAARPPSPAARSPPSRSSPTPTSATRSRPPACRSSTASARRSPRRSARRRRSRRRCSTPPSARSTARSRRPCSSPATSPTTRSATSSTQALATLNGKTVDPDSGAQGLRRRPGARLRRPVLLPPRPRRARPPRRARRRADAVQGERAWTRPGTRSSATTTCSRRARCRSTPEIDAFATGDRLVPSLDPKLKPPREEASAQAAVAALLGGNQSPRHDRGPRRQDRRLNEPGEAERRLGHPTWTTRRTSATHVRAILLDTVNRDGTSQARIARPRSNGCAPGSPRPETAGSSSSPTTR